MSGTAEPPFHVISDLNWFAFSDGCIAYRSSESLLMRIDRLFSSSIICDCGSETGPCRRRVLMRSVCQSRKTLGFRFNALLVVGSVGSEDYLDDLLKSIQTNRWLLATAAGL